MKKCLLLLLCSFWVLPAFASREDKIREYWKMQGVDVSEMISQTLLDPSTPMACTFVFTESGKATLKQEIKELSQPLEKELRSLLEVFTEEELDELIKWGNSDLGRKERSLQPKILPVIQSHMATIMPYILPKIDKFFPRRAEQEADMCLKAKGF